MTVAQEEVDTRLHAAVEIARAAGQLTLKFFQQDNVQVQRKADDSPVTQADRQAERLMRERIGRSFPRDGIIGEEFGQQGGDSGFDWTVDPIDGTKSFISGVPLYSVLIGVLYDKASVAGVIVVPALDEYVYAARGQGAWWVKGEADARRACVSSRPTLADGLFLTSQVDSFAERNAADAYLRLERAAYITRTWGDAYGYLLVATGRGEAMVDPVMNLWDAAPLQPILEEAGGTFTDWNGEPTVHNGEGVATNGQVLEEVLAITRDYPRGTGSGLDL